MHIYGSNCLPVVYSKVIIIPTKLIVHFCSLYDSLLMENLNNIINDYRSNLYDLSSKEFYIVLGDKNNQDIDAYISIEYIDDPVCEEEYASGFFIDFKM